MSSVTDFDERFVVKSPDNNGMVFFDSTEAPFRVYGLLHDDDGYFRMTREIADKVSPGVSFLNRHTAGGRIRFRTDAGKVSIKVKLSDVGRMPHFAFTGSVGLDVYVDNHFEGSFIPPMEGDCYESEKYLLGGEMHEICINFPLYSGVRELRIGLPDGSTLAPPTEYRFDKPVVYYGSSITQGGCASRPGTAYEAIITRKLDVDHVNLGFSGCGLAEDIMIDYIAGLDMLAFVSDYDHNSPNVEHLKSTHEKLFLKVRANHPDIPILLVSRPELNLGEDGKARRAVIRTTYENALERGDKNVYFIDGSTFFELFGGEDCTVDRCHPNDVGFACMAQVIGKKLGEVL